MKDLISSSDERPVIGLQKTDTKALRVVSAKDQSVVKAELDNTATKVSYGGWEDPVCHEHVLRPKEPVGKSGQSREQHKHQKGRFPQASQEEGEWNMLWTMPIKTENSKTDYNRYYSKRILFQNEVGKIILFTRKLKQWSCHPTIEWIKWAGKLDQWKILSDSKHREDDKLDRLQELRKLQRFFGLPRSALEECLAEILFWILEQRIHSWN